MQITIDTLAAARTGLAANVKNASPAIDTGFLAAINAAEITDAPVAAVNAENKAAVNETTPVEIYQAATGRTVEQSLPSWKYWDDESLAQALGHGAQIDTSKGINWEATGEKKLTEEQINSLKKKYDVTNLSSQEYYDLMSELTNMDVLSAEDCVGVNTLYINMEVPALRLIPYPHKPLSFYAKDLCPTSGNLIKSLSSALDILKEQLELIDSDEYMEANNHITEETRARDRAVMEKNIHTRQTMLNILSQLQ